MLMGCQNTTPPVAIPVPPPVAESALKDFSKVKMGIDSSISTNIKIDEKVKEQLKNVIDQKASIQDALDQAQQINDKVLAKQVITEIEAINLVSEIKKIKVRNLFLETQNSDFNKLVNEQANILTITKLGAVDTESKLRNKEQEANQLRDQNTFLAKNLDVKNKESENLKDALTKEKEISASAKTYRNIVWVIVGVWIAWTILKNIISLYSPIKFRI
jgi:hypothetical protein